MKLASKLRSSSALEQRPHRPLAQLLSSNINSNKDIYIYIAHERDFEIWYSNLTSFNSKSVERISGRKL